MTSLFALTLSCVWSVISYAQEPAKANPPAVNLAELPVGISANVCARCHSGGRAMEEPRLILHDEFDTWQSIDPHRRAFQTLKNERSREIGKRLYGDPDVTANQKCLVCHATNAQLKPRDPGFSINEEGVSCVACHGTAREWVVEHALGDYETWMKRSAREKASVFGMTDLRASDVRSQLCLSCHRGDRAHGKVLTHAMFVAGHPPLSSIDLTEASQLFPKHWLDPHKTPYISQAPASVQRDGYHFTPGDFLSVRKVTTAAVVSLDIEIREFISSERLIDFARYDCTSCHRELTAFTASDWHELANRNPAQKRVLSPIWPAQVLKIRKDLNIAEVGEFEEGIQAILNARQVPFREVMTDESKRLRHTDTLARWSEQRGRSSSNRHDAEMLLRELWILGQSETINFDSARQIAWSTWSIVTELNLSEDRSIKGFFTLLDSELALSLFVSKSERFVSTNRDWIKAQEKFDSLRIRAHFTNLFSRLP